MLLEGQCWPTIFPNKALEPAAMEVVWVALLGGCVGQPSPQTGLWCQCPGKLCGLPCLGAVLANHVPKPGSGASARGSCVGPLLGGCVGQPSPHVWFRGKRPRTIKKSFLGTQGPFFGAIAVLDASVLGWPKVQCAGTAHNQEVHP